MGVSRSSSSASVQTGTSQPVFNLYPSPMVKDSKAQSILGLSRTELHDARGESLGSKPKSRSLLFSHTESPLFRNPLARARNKLTKTSTREAGPNTQYRTHDTVCYLETDATSPLQVTSHRRFPSSSTLRSSCDGSPAPPKASQQTSNSSSREFLLRKVNPDITSTQNQDMEHSRSIRFLQSPRLRSIKENRDFDEKLPELDSKDVILPVSRASSISEDTSKSPVVTRVSFASRPSTPAGPHPRLLHVATSKSDKNANSSFLQGRTAGNTIINPITHTPYAKVHVRRPKAGTKHWFDDIEDLSSDEEEEFELETEKECVVGAGNVAELDPPVTSSHIVDTIKKTRVLVKVDQVTPRSNRSPPSGSDLAELQKTVTLPPQKSLQNRIPKSNPFETADLNQESILCLSASDDERDEQDEKDERDNLSPLQPVKVLDSPLQLRKNIAEPVNEGSNIVSTRLAAMTKRPINRRPSPIKIGDIARFPAESPSSPPTTPASRSDTRHVFRPLEAGYSDESDARDTDEDVLLSSFPATPTESNRPRSSISLSDDRSVVSMRLMKVTRQEENLIAAMRMKRAAMKRAEKAAMRKIAASNIAEEKIVVPPRPSNVVDNVLPSSEIVNGSKASVSNLVGSQRSSEVLPLAHYSSGLRSPSMSPIHSENRLPGRSSTSLTRKSYGPFPRAHSFGPASTGTPQKRGTNMIVLDNLDSALQSPNLPSQLLLESPFMSWEKSNSATVH